MNKTDSSKSPPAETASCDRSDGSTFRCLVVWATGKCTNSCKTPSEDSKPPVDKSPN